MNRPPSTSHIVGEAKPENTACGDAIANTIASRKNSSDVMCSGMLPSAHSPTVSTISAAACMVAALTPAGGGRKKITVAAMHSSAVGTEVSRGTLRQPLCESLLEFRRERVARAQEPDVGADGDEQIAHVEAALAVGLADEYARRLARLADPLRRVFHHFPHFGMLPVAQITHVSGQIVGADE